MNGEAEDKPIRKNVQKTLPGAGMTRMPPEGHGYFRKASLESKWKVKQPPARSSFTRTSNRHRREHNGRTLQESQETFCHQLGSDLTVAADESKSRELAPAAQWQ